MLIALQIIGGLLLLVAGGEALVRGAVSLANRVGIPIVIIGLTIVAMGTSAPEMVVAVMASLGGHPDITLGNVVGSNVANSLLVLGATALVYPVASNPALGRRDGIFLLAVSLLTVWMMQDALIGRMDGGVLLALFSGYLGVMYLLSRKKQPQELVQEFEEEASFRYSLLLAVPMIIAGIGFLVYGAQILVEGSSTLARLFGISEAVIGSTIVAAGTSAPELVTCVVAACRKHADIALANVLGSNLFNLIAVLGMAGVITPVAVSGQFMYTDGWIMVAASVVLLPMMLFFKQIGRLPGALLLLGYGGYLYYQYLLAIAPVTTG